MGLFDIFRSKDKDGAKKSGGSASKWAEAAGNKRAQNYDRQEALEALAAMGTVDAAEALLKRFTFSIDPSITDQDEKELAFEGILKAGADALGPVRTFAAKAESLAWPMRILKALVSEDEYVKELLKWLERWDTEYSKFIDPKLQLLSGLEDFKQDGIADGVEKFLEDVNEPARFHAVATTLVQDVDASERLAKVLADEESVRIRNKISAGYVEKGWSVPEELREKVRAGLTSDYTLSSDGKIQKR